MRYPLLFILLLPCALVWGQSSADSTVVLAVQDSANTETFTVKGISFKMVYVEGGTFTMGCTDEQGDDCGSDEKPKHQVTLSGFQMGQFEVTQELYEAVMGANPSSFPRDTSEVCPTCPVEKVRWDDAKDFIKKLNGLTKGGFRLPTEAEWEYAARGGKSAKATKYAGSNTVDEVTWYNGNASSKTHPVGQKKPNELGIYDMSGNVYEWCEDDWHDDYSSNPPSNGRAWIDSPRGSRRVRRGGSWPSSASYTRVSYRDVNSPDHSYSNVGFRLARTQ